METEVNAILQTVNEGLKALPPLASDAFELMIKGTRIEGSVNLVLIILGLIALSFVARFLYKLSKNPNSLETKGYYSEGNMKEGVVLLLALGGLFCIITGGALISELPTALKSIIAPEYMLIRQLFF